MRRLSGIVLLLVGALLLTCSAVMLYAIYASFFAGRFSLLRVLVGGAFLAGAVLTLRRSARILAMRRAAFAGAALGAVSVILLVTVGTALSVSEWSPRARQKRTMSDLRNIAAALEARAQATDGYPSARNFEELAPYLAPAYIKTLPQRDHWGHPLRYEPLGSVAAPDGYAIGSAARDGAWQRPHLRDYARALTTSFDDDIVYSNGEFVQFPDSGPHPH
jgi:type II secretory pathway pseudopilin PulG